MPHRSPRNSIPSKSAIQSLHIMLPHNKHPEFRKSFLFNLRDGDFQSGGQISKGEVVQGKNGYVAAESHCPGWNAVTVTFRPNRKCEWQQFKLPCMAIPKVPVENLTKKALRSYNYVLATVTNAEVAARAKKLELPCVVTPNGDHVINLEISRFSPQRKAGRATLL